MGLAARPAGAERGLGGGVFGGGLTRLAGGRKPRSRVRIFQSPSCLTTSRRGLSALNGRSLKKSKHTQKTFVVSSPAKPSASVLAAPRRQLPDCVTRALMTSLWVVEVDGDGVGSGDGDGGGDVENTFVACSWFYSVFCITVTLVLSATVSTYINRKRAQPLHPVRDISSRQRRAQPLA